MKKNLRKRFLASLAAMLLLLTPASGIDAANVEETEGVQLQTILIDNNGNDWTTKSWGGHTMTPNTNWTTLDIEDYYENGVLSFEVKNNGTGSVNFRLGLYSKCHGETVSIMWTDLEQYKDYFVAGTEWTSYSLPIKEIVDAYPDSGFDLNNFWYVYTGGIPSDTTLTFQNMRITSTDDERQYPMIKVNQVGYLCNGAKSARISYFEKFGSLNGKTYEIVNAETEEVVLYGTLSEAEYEDTFAGEMVHTVQFDELTQPGTYYIRVPDANLDASARSPRDIAEGLEVDTLTSVTFTVGNNVYDTMFNDLTKYYYYQRQGIAIEEEFAGIFARDNLHPNDITVMKWSDRDNPDAETFDVSGGWYDAGDYGKYTSPGAASIEDLLLAYELYPEAFDNLAMRIPETDPTHSAYVDAPGILSEMKYEIDMLLKLEHSSKDGSFYVAANYNNGVMYLEDTLYQTSNHESDPSEIDIRCHYATADMAAMLAHAYIVYKDVPAYADFAEECLATAKRAWNWVTDPANEIHTSIGAANRTYTSNESTIRKDTFWAAGSLYRAVTLAGEDASAYESYIVENCANEEMQACFTSACVSYAHSGRAFLGFFHYLFENENPDPAVTEAFAGFATWRKRMVNYDCWGIDYPTWGYWWGSNKTIAQSAMTMVLGDMVSDSSAEEHEQAITTMESAFHYMLGINPVSFSYVSGHGTNCVQNIYSAIYTTDARLEPYQCPAGYFTEGSNIHNNPNLSKFTGKCYMDSDGEYTTNENTIYGNAAMLFLTSAMLAENAVPSVEGDVNADGTCSVLDAVMLQKWLLGSGEITDAQAGDLDHNGILDTFDLALLKRKLLNA